MKNIIMMLMLLVPIAAGCRDTPPEPLGTREIVEYQGQELSMAARLPENSIAGPQEVDLDGYRLQVDGLVYSPQSYSYAEVLKKKSYTKLIILHCVEGWSATILWEGIKLADLIESAGPRPEVNTVIFHAADGYTTSLPINYIRDKDILLAYAANGLALPARLGYPFIVVAEDKLGYKWARWVTRIELSDDADYQGYWEQRGFSNQADVK